METETVAAVAPVVEPVAVATAVLLLPTEIDGWSIDVSDGLPMV